MYTLKKPIAVALDIRTLKDMWKAAILLQSQGNYDTDAMYAIYQDMNPKLTIQDIANVCSGVYADTYWNTTYLDPALLAKSLVQAIGLDPALATTYANKSIAQWRGILCRKNINDVGAIPVTGNYTTSLDIVCNQNTPIQPKELIANWNNEYWKQPQVGPNFIYARCQNVAFDGAITPKVQMFFSQGGFNQGPSSWVQCFTVDGKKKVGNVVAQDGTVSPLNWGDRGASEAFSFNPTSQNHVCVISAVTSEPFFASNNPLQIPPGNWNSVTWITRNGAAAWHNVDPQIATEDTLAYFNQDGTDEKFVFFLNCRNVPVGSRIRLRSEDAGAKFDTGDMLVQHPSQTLQHTVTVPPYHKGQLKVKLEGPSGNLLPATAAVEIKMAWKLPHTHTHYVDAAELIGAVSQLRSSQDIQLEMGTYTILGSGK
ncbi:hypothetical protein [Undibacterium sp.]|jgi:hypothetical protein|uniref:hypothetical protein n=1 Tax=Undibacterium sp. TaxID=1914977 RepID=UPI002BADC0DC|nr:hypothetical protein [Undibacterium sp.]HTD06032.1 hypothetical protein [Undibacterium sp.]